MYAVPSKSIMVLFLRSRREYAFSLAPMDFMPTPSLVASSFFTSCPSILSMVSTSLVSSVLMAIGTFSLYF